MQLNRVKNMECRRGLAMFELVTSAVAMVTIMSFVTTLCFRTSNIWKDIGQQRVAVSELSNQLDRLTRMKLPQIEKELQSLEPSGYCKKTLREAQLFGKLEQSDLGPHITLKINWKRRFAGKPIALVGWVANVNVDTAKFQSSTADDSEAQKDGKE